MANAQFRQAERKRPGVNPQPSLPSAPPETGVLAQWMQRESNALRYEFSRFGMLANALSELEDTARFRMRILRKF